MGHYYRAVGWNRQKRIYDGVMLLGIGLYLVAFIGVGATLFPHITAETLMIRGLGTAALVLLHIVLSIGSLCRLERRFLPLLYNRRHLGVATFVVGFLHGLLALIQFHGFGDIHPLVSLFVGNYTDIGQFAFQPLGVLALVILFLMAATSHDFWLANLTSPVWKALHMLVYFAYALLVMHVTLGVLQAETNPLLAAMLGAGIVWIVGIHLLAAHRERHLDRESPASTVLQAVCRVDEIPEKRAKIVQLAGERIAIFKYDGKISAVSNACQHQNGPLGEGKIIDGCITCPWHGYQYRPEDGASPPPFTEKVPTFRVQVRDNQVWVDPRPLPPGTAVEPALLATT